MKKLFLLILMILSVLSLSACSTGIDYGVYYSQDKDDPTVYYIIEKANDGIYGLDSQIIYAQTNAKKLVGNSALKNARTVFVNAAKFKNLEGLFENCESLERVHFGNYSGLYIKNKKLDKMFYNCKNLNAVSFNSLELHDNWTVTGDNSWSSSTNNGTPFSAKQMFYNCINLKEISLWRDNIDGYKMFEGCENLKVINFPFTTLYNVEGIFDGCKSLRTIYCLDNDAYAFRSNTQTDYPIFKDCINIAGGCGTKYDSNNVGINMAYVDEDIFGYEGYFTRFEIKRNGWYGDYYYIDDVIQKNTYITNGFCKYYLGDDGISIKNDWYDGHYFGKDGVMYINKETPDGKFVNGDGIVVDIEKDFMEIDKDEIEANAWFQTKAGIWYYFEGDRTTLKKGWFHDDRDDQTYYLNPETGIMATGWTEIDGDMYYFNEDHSTEPNWYYVEENDTWESYGKKIKALGSMFRDEETPDGKKVDADGKLIK